MSDDRIHSRYSWTPTTRWVLRQPADAVQMSLEDFDLDTEHIDGGMPADSAEAEKSREDFYQRFREHVEALKPIFCMPTYGVHVYASGASKCICGKSKEKK